jgi:hypothetical protein
VAIESVDYVGNEPGDDEDANDQVAENAEVIVQRSDGTPKATELDPKNWTGS